MILSSKPPKEPSQSSQVILFRSPTGRSATILSQPQANGKIEMRIKLGSWSNRGKEEGIEVAVHPSGRFVYQVIGSRAHVAQFQIHQNGRLSVLEPSPVPAHSHPTAITFHPNGRFVYVSCSHSAICQYRIGAKGHLIALSPSEVYAATNPGCLYFDRSGRFACVVAYDERDLGNEGGLPASERGDYVYCVYRIRPDGTLQEIQRKRTSDAPPETHEMPVRVRTDLIR